MTVMLSPTQDQPRNSMGNGWGVFGLIHIVLYYHVDWVIQRFQFQAVSIGLILMNIGEAAEHTSTRFEASKPFRNDVCDIM